jgi:hypothetical protein
LTAQEFYVCDPEPETRHQAKKRGEPTSHRYNRLPLLPSGPGGVQQELVVPTRQLQKYHFLFCSRPGKTRFVKIKLKRSRLLKSVGHKLIDSVFIDVCFFP